MRSYYLRTTAWAKRALKRDFIEETIFCFSLNKSRHFARIDPLRVAWVSIGTQISRGRARHGRKGKGKNLLNTEKALGRITVDLTSAASESLGPLSPSICLDSFGSQELKPSAELWCPGLI